MLLSPPAFLTAGATFAVEFFTTKEHYWTTATAMVTWAGHKVHSAVPFTDASSFGGSVVSAFWAGGATTLIADPKVFEARVLGILKEKDAANYDALTTAVGKPLTAESLAQYWDGINKQPGGAAAALKRNGSLRGAAAAAAPA